MRHFNPAATLLTIACLAACVLIYLDQRSPAVDLLNTVPSQTVTANTITSPGSSLNPVTAANVGAAVHSPASASVMTEGTAASVLPPTSPPAISATSSDAVHPGSESSRNVTVRVSGLKSQDSRLLIAIFESSEGFPKSEHSTTAMTEDVTADTLEFSLRMREQNPTAIAVFQDLDANGKLTKNAFGIPTEPYGFSNNARSMLGPPTFTQAAVTVSEKTPLLEIKVR